MVDTGGDDMAKRKTTLMQLIEVRHGEPIDKLLSRLYWDEGMTLLEIGEHLGISEGAVSRWMERLNIPTRLATTSSA